MRNKDGAEQNRPRQDWVESLIEMFKSLEGRKNVIINKNKNIRPQELGWQETEEEYQKAQGRWLQEVEEKKRSK